jgi:hypothetical protein
MTTPTAFACKRRIIAGLSIHAIASRYRRGVDKTDRAIGTDIFELALNASRFRDGHCRTFSLHCPEGNWVGNLDTVQLSNGHYQQLLNIRCFLQHV